MSKEAMSNAFNEWMRRFTDEPERFEREFESVGRFLQEQSSGAVPSYGETAAAYLHQVAEEQAAAA